MARAQMDDFALLNEMAAIAAERARALERLVCAQTPIRGRETHSEKMLALRQTLLESLKREFIPPIDRADILAIADQLVEIRTAIEDAEDALAIYAQIMSMDMLSLLSNFSQTTDALQNAVANLRGIHKPSMLEASIRRLHDACAEVHAQYRQSMRLMSTRAGNPGAYMLRIRGLDALAAANARIARMAALLDGIVLKNT